MDVAAKSEMTEKEERNATTTDRKRFCGGVFVVKFLSFLFRSCVCFLCVVRAALRVQKILVLVLLHY